MWEAKDDRYLNPKYSRWLSTDPALGEYIPAAGKANSKDAASLPGMGGAFNHINFNLYHYAGNNPVKYTDPDGRNKKTLADDNPAPHESGHLLGLKDRYHDNPDGNRSIREEGWESNIMANSYSGHVEQRNIDSILLLMPDIQNNKQGVLKAGRMVN